MAEVSTTPVTEPATIPVTVSARGPSTTTSRGPSTVPATEPTTKAATETSTEPTSGDTTLKSNSNTKIVLQQEALGILRKMYANATGAASSMSGKTVSSDPTIQALKSVGLESGFASSFDSMIASVASNLNNIVNTMLSAYESVSGVDLDINNLIPKTENNNRKTGGGSNYSNSAYNSKNSETKVADQKNYKSQIESYSNMSLSDLSNIAQLLKDTAEKNNISVSDLLNDEKYEEVLKQALLENNLDETLISLIKEDDSGATQKALRDVMTGKADKLTVGVDDDTLTTLNYYLVSIANENNMTLEELLSEENSAILKAALSQFSKLSEVIGELNADNYQSIIEKIYLEDTDDIGKALLKLDIEVNGGIEDNNYTYDKLEKLGKFAVFAEVLSNYDHKDLHKALETIYGVTDSSETTYGEADAAKRSKKSVTINGRTYDMYNQHDFDDVGFSGENVGSAGCSLIAFTQAASGFDRDLTVFDAATMFSDRTFEGIGSALDKLGISHSNIIYYNSNDYENTANGKQRAQAVVDQVRSHMSEGKPVIAMTQGAPYSGSQPHFITLFGEDENGNLITGNSRKEVGSLEELVAYSLQGGKKGFMLVG